MSDTWKWIVWFWDAKVLRRDVCRPDCPLCEVNARVEAHYDACEVCQTPGPFNPCATMKALQAEEDAATLKVFPDLAETSTASSATSFVTKTWDMTQPRPGAPEET